MTETKARVLTRQDRQRLRELSDQEYTSESLVIRRLLDHIDTLEDGLREIAKAEGPFKRDRLAHAESTIEHMIGIARRLLGEEGDGG